MALASGRIEPMNASPNHSKIRVTIHLADPLFVAGEELVGKMEMDCRADKGLGIGVMMIELFAVQGNTTYFALNLAEMAFDYRVVFEGPFRDIDVSDQPPAVSRTVSTPF